MPLETDVALGSGWSSEFGARPGSLDSRQMFLPRLELSLLAVTSGGGGGEHQFGCLKPTHIPWAVSYLDVTAVLQPIPAFCQKPSIFTQPWLFHLQLKPDHLPETNAAPPPPLSACWVRRYSDPQGPALTPLGPGPQAGHFTGGCLPITTSPAMDLISFPFFSSSTKSSTPWHKV